jgi:hypothetical protein
MQARLLLPERCGQSRLLNLRRAPWSETARLVEANRPQHVAALKMTEEKRTAPNQFSATPAYRYWGINE